MCTYKINAHSFVRYIILNEIVNVCINSQFSNTVI